MEGNLTLETKTVSVVHKLVVSCSRVGFVLTSNFVSFDLVQSANRVRFSFGFVSVV